MNRAKRLLISMLTLLCCCTGTWALDRDTEGYYILSSLQDWKDFATLVQSLPTVNARMVADIDLGDDQTMVGSYNTRYSGIFDGQGHTLTFNYNTSSMSIESGQSSYPLLGAAPFRDIEDATIRNLHTAGSITADKIGASGLVGWTYGTSTIENCWSDVNIVSSNNTADTFTGFVAFMCGTSISITDCIFTGLIQSASKYSHGGFIGWHNSGTSALTNCLVILDEGSDTNQYNDWGVTFFTFDRFAKEDQSTGTYTNCYYYRDFGVVQGTKVTDEQLADGSITTALQAGRAETVWVQDATSSQPRLDVFNHPVTTYEPYVHDGSQIINLSELTEDYIAQDGDVLTGTTGYSVQIAADATITLSNVTITNWRKSPIQCLGNATINIEDGTVNTLRDSDEDSNSYGRPALAFGPSGTTLTINGNTGRLIAIGGRLSSAIGCRDNRVAYGGLIINGGVISAHGNSSYTSGIGAVGADDSHGSSCGDITINGGTINAAASDGIGIGAGGPNSCGAITINGGTITSHAVRSIAIGGNCSKVVINGGNINASTTTSVGIGSSGVVYIEGGTIVASASDWEGVGISGDKGVLIRSSITSLTASKGPYGANAIQGATVYISANLNDVTEGNTRTLTPKASFEPESDLVQDGAGYYLIADVTNWKEFAILSQIETSPKGKLVADINLGDEQAIIGSFDGLFDGQGHTLTVNLTSTANVCGVFRYVANGATIQNLRIAGTINGAHRWIGGFVGEGTGTYYINNCISSVTINTTYSGDGVQGGFVAAQRGTLYMNDCIFDGVFNGPNAYTWGGFVGWYYGGSTLTNCLVLCDEYNVRMSDVATFIAMSGTLNNCYYKSPIGTAQGTQATTAELADGSIAYKLQADRVDLIWGQRIGIDAEPVLTNDESYRVYKSKNGGYTNNPAQAYEGLKQDAEGYYLLGCLCDWQNFAAIVNNGTNTTANAKMTADIDLGDDQTMIGSYHQRYQGTFDGQGYTLTVNYNTSGMSFETEQRDLNLDFLGAGPFKDIQGATIRNLHTAGIITADKIGAAGLVGWTYGTNIIEQCWSDVDIVSSNNTADTFAGFVAFQYGTQLSITDCVYTGKIQSESNISHGGFVAFQKVGVTNLNNCLLILDEGSDVNTTASAGYKFYTFVRNFENHNGINTINNCYYLTPFGVEQGTQTTAAELADGSIAYKLQADRVDLIWGQRIGIDAEPVLTNDESYRVYKSKNGGYTNDPTLAYEGLKQDTEGYYLLGCLSDWQEFAEIVNSGTNTAANAKMTADIDLGDDQTMISDNVSYRYSGVFDGQGHKLNVHYYSSETTVDGGYYIAPFRDIQGATIKNLTVTGNITGYMHCAGVAGVAFSPSTNLISNVTVSANITILNTHGGGFIGHNENATTTIQDCLFNGTINGKSGGSTVGVFFGWSESSATMSLINCLENGSYTNCSTFTPTSCPGYAVPTVTNCYYAASESYPGTQATSAQLSDGTIAYKLQADRVDLIWGQRIDTDTEPVLTNDESYRVYLKNGVYTNDPTQAYESLEKDAEGYYLLGSVQDWKDFATLVQTTPTANAKMTADINLGSDQTMIGSYATRYSGIFDGQGYTLTFNYNTSSMSIESDQDFLGAAPFRDIEGATIRNLHTAGSITADKIGASGLVGWAYGTNTIEKCWSDVNIVSSNDNADTFTGFVAFMYGTSISITDCIFTGLIQSTSKLSHSGFIGYHHSGTSALTNCLVILDEGSDASKDYPDGTKYFTFERFYIYDQSPGEGTYTNCYYYRDFGVAQGTKVTDAQLANGTTTTALQAGRAEIVWVQDPVTNQPMLAIFAGAVTLTDGDNLTTLSTYAGTTCKVAYSRSFTAGMSSTVCLPFAFAKGSVGTFYTFTGISKSGSEYIADMTEYTGDNLEANTPYLFTPSATGNVDFGGTYAIPASLTAGLTVSGDWTFLGTYETVSWTEAPTGIYGFSAQAVDDISQGEFVKVGAYVRIRPMRCYLKYKNGTENYAGARSMTRGAEAEPLPETIKVRLIGANGEVTAIGSLQTKTGEMTFDSDAWYTLDGVQLDGKPTRKGIYVNNGKKVIIK